MPVMPNNHWSRVQGLQMVLFNFFVTSNYVIVSIKLCLHHVWYETNAFEITDGVVPDFVIGSPATSSSSVLKREGEFLSTGDWNDININWKKYSSHPYMSDVAYQLVKTQSGVITHVKARYTGNLMYTNKFGRPFQLQNLETGFSRK